MLGSEFTSFSLDNMGRYLCNTLQEALDSTGLTVAGQPRDFDVIIVGGGTFGSVIAQHLLFNDKTRSRRILVLEQGPFVLPEHVQNLPWMGGTPDFRKPWVSDDALKFPGLLYAIGGRSLAWGGWSPELLNDPLNNEMKGWIPTVVDELKKRYFAESSEQLGVSSTNDFIYGTLHEGMRRQLFEGIQAGSNPGGVFVDLPLGKLPDHPAIREYVRKNGTAPSDAQLRAWLNLPSTDTTSRTDLLNLLKLEAPLAVQSTTEPGLFPFNKFSAIPLLAKAARVASMEADGAGTEPDSRKRLMVVPGCHVQELITETQPDNWVRVTGVRAIDKDGNSREIRLAPPKADGRQSVVILALGTIETTRVALTTLQSSLAGRAAERMGQNLMAHLRSNLNIRVPRKALTKLPSSSLQSLETSALFVKGKAKINGNDRFFHLQITASGLNKLGSDSEAELFKKIPDIDQFETMLAADDQYVVITLRGIGEMEPHNPSSRVGVATTPGDVDFARPQAYVQLNPTQNDNLLWDAMDRYADQVAAIFANGEPFEVIVQKDNQISKIVPITVGNTANQLDQLKNNVSNSDRRDRLGTTHHETGTLRMSENPADGVTNEYGRIHDTTNCYVLGPALFPTIGSPNPMLTGVALARRTADMLTERVLPKPVITTASSPFISLFDGSEKSFKSWVWASPSASNGFALINGELVTYGGKDFGLLYYAGKAFNNNDAFSDFTLRVQFRIFDTQNHNSGIFVRFRDPLLTPPSAILAQMQQESANEKNFRSDLLSDIELFNGDPNVGRPSNRAWSAVYSGFEIQIDDTAKGDPRKDFYGIPEPNGLWKNRTGAIYKIPAGDSILHKGQTDIKLQNYQPAPNLIPGVWYEYEIDVRGNTYTVDLTNLDTNVKVRTTTFTNTDPVRGVAVENGQPIGYIGLQSYPGAKLAFRQIQIRP